LTLYAVVKAAVYAIARILWRVRVFGAQRVPRKGPLIVACNHVSLVDPPVLGSCCPRTLHYMAKRQLFAIPLLGPAIRALGAFPVDREGSATGAIKRSIEVLRVGEAIGIFPEGGRNPRSDAPARLGVALLASISGAPVLPAAIVGSTKALRLGAMRVVFGDPMRLDAGRKATREDLAKFTDAVMKEIHTLAKSVDEPGSSRA
jgi:1-acyl-sn-glycerol-3-phosphate acyltransferase